MRFQTKDVARSFRALETLEGRAYLSVPSVLPFIGPQAGAAVPIYLPTQPATQAVVAQDWARLIHLDTFRNDSRSAGIDGSGFSTVIIDSGADLNHPFFGPDANHDGVADRIVYQYDFGNNDADATDHSDHGSNVASLVGSQDATFPGVAPGVNLIILKAFTDAGSGNFGMMEQALRWVVNNAATYHVSSVNLSLGDGENHASSTQLYGIGDELDSLAQMDVKVVASAGNSFYRFNSQTGVAYPAADPNVIGVGAVFSAIGGSYRADSGATAYSTVPDQITPFSQRGTHLSTIFAPGVYMTGANHAGGTVTMSGTSQASPVIAGLAALSDSLASSVLGRALTLAEFRSILTTTAAAITDGDDENDNVDNTNLRFGRVDAMAMGEAILAMADHSAPNRAPTLTAVAPLAREIPGRPFVVTYERLLAASNAGDADGDVIQFRFTGVLSGSLLKDGSPITVGVTTLRAGEYVIWKPSTVRLGGTDAFSVVAFDGQASSAGDTLVNIVAGPTIVGITSRVQRDQRGQPGPTSRTGSITFLGRRGSFGSVGGDLGAVTGTAEPQGWSELVSRGRPAA